MANRGALVLDVFSIIFACAIVQFGIWQVTGESVFFLQFWYIHQFAPPLWLIGYTVAALAVIVLVIFCNPIKAKRGEYGYAAWATPVDVRNMRDKGKRGDKGLFSDSGLILGKAWGRYLKMDQPLSVALFAPPGTGKTAGFVIPNLFSCGNSKIVFDPKGELYDTTSKRRATFSTVIRFAPAESRSAQWNPLAKAMLPADWPAQVVEVGRIAELLYQTAGVTGSEVHWVTEGKALFIFFCLYLVWRDGGTSLPAVRNFMLSSDGPQGFIASLLDEDGDHLPDEIKKEGNALLSKAPNEFASVLSTSKSKLNVFSDPYVSAAMDGNDFTFAAFRQRCHTLYFCVGAQDVDRLAPLVRLLFESCAMYILSNAPAKSDLIITLMIDEFPRLGKMDAVLNMPALARGNRGQACLIAQDYAQN